MGARQIRGAPVETLTGLARHDGDCGSAARKPSRSVSLRHRMPSGNARSRYRDLADEQAGQQRADAGGQDGHLVRSASSTYARDIPIVGNERRGFFDATVMRAHPGTIAPAPNPGDMSIYTLRAPTHRESEPAGVARLMRLALHARGMGYRRLVAARFLLEHFGLSPVQTVWEASTKSSRARLLLSSPCVPDRRLANGGSWRLARRLFGLIGGAFRAWRTGGAADDLGAAAFYLCDVLIWVVPIFQRQTVESVIALMSLGLTLLTAVILLVGYRNSGRSAGRRRLL